MTSDVFTLHPEDLVDLGASLMDWERLCSVPVEDQTGHLLGMLSYRSVLRLLSRGRAKVGVPVREIMDHDPPTIRPEATTLEALQTMRAHDVSALAVVNREGRLIGIVTDHDFLLPPPRCRGASAARPNHEMTPFSGGGRNAILSG
jgi:CBS domain-containing protein